MIETIWMYTGFIVLTALAWALAGALAWLGAQFIWAVWQKYGRYKRVVELLDFLDENGVCKEKFEEWLDEKSSPYTREFKTDIDVVSGGYSGVSEEEERGGGAGQES